MTRSQEGGTSTLSQTGAVWRRVLISGEITSLSSVGEGTSTETLVAIPSALSLEPHYLVSPSITIVHSESPSLCWSLGEWL